MVLSHYDLVVVPVSVDFVLWCCACLFLAVRTVREKNYSIKEKTMKPSTKNEIKGKAHEVKGKIKEKVGKAINNPDMEAEGQAENLAGKIQNKVGHAGKVLGS